MKVAVRPLEVDDRAEWEALYRAYQAFYGHYDRPIAFYETAFQRLMAKRPDDFSGLIAEADGQIVGLVHYVFHPSLWRNDGVCYLQDLFAAADARGKGVGRALIEAVYAAADKSGHPAVYWLTAEDNVQARKLYDQVAVLSPFIRYNRPL